MHAQHAWRASACVMSCVRLCIRRALMSQVCLWSVRADGGGGHDGASTSQLVPRTVLLGHTAPITWLGSCRRTARIPPSSAPWHLRSGRAPWACPALRCSARVQRGVESSAYEGAHLGQVRTGGSHRLTLPRGLPQRVGARRLSLRLARAHAARVCPIRVCVCGLRGAEISRSSGLGLS